MPDANVALPLSEAPRNVRADELNHTGAKYQHEGKYDAARLHYLAALSLEPNHAEALQNLSGALYVMEKFEAAASIARRAVKASNNNPYARSNLGIAALGLKRYREAINIFRAVVEDIPNEGAAWHNFGLALYMSGDFKNALEAFNKAIGLKYTPQHVLSDRAMAMLALGDIQRGLEAYEVRWERLTKSPVWELGIPEWKGEDLTGKRIVVHHEQGFGDGIMLARWIEKLRKYRDVEITIAVPPSLLRLFKQNFHLLARIANMNEPNDVGHTHDYHTPMLSMVRWLGIKLDDDNWDKKVYLRATPNAATFPITLPKAQLHVGVCWASGDHGPMLRRRRRMVPLDLFLLMSELDGVRLISLQKGPEVQHIVDFGLEGIVYDAMARVDDWADTACVINDLDVVISVDSAVAHLAGAMGKPTIMLSPYTRCWRWWGETTGSPWYARMKIFSQGEDGTWRQAIKAATMLVADRSWPLTQ